MTFETMEAIVADYIAAKNALDALVAQKRLDMAEWDRTINAARKRLERAYAELKGGARQPELPFSPSVPRQESPDGRAE